jgi:nucleoside-diphosphate-sugar epimerase
MNRVLITGGNGFLGSNLARFFLKKGYTVAVISRSCSNINDLLESIQFIKHSTPGYEDLSQEIINFSPTIVIHSAWDGGNAYKDVNSLNQYQNIPQGIELLEVLSTLPDKPIFVGIGSFSEYGKIATSAVETDIDNPTTRYGQSKSCFRTISQKMCEQFGMSWRWIRPCLIYGPGDVSTRLIPSLIQKQLLSEDITLDSCNSIVDYLHVEDFCSGVFISIQSLSGIVNLCSGNEYSVRTIVELLQKETSSKSVIKFDSSKDRHLLSNRACGISNKLRSAGWIATVTLVNGLRDLVLREKVKHLLKKNPVELDGIHLEG